MPKIICALENSGTEINGIKFVPHEDGMRVISEADVGEPHLSIFLSIPGYSVDEDGEPPAKVEKKTKAETPKQRAARLKAEQEAAEQEEADRLAAEEAERLAAEAEAGKQKQADAQQGNSDEESGEVF